MESREEIKFKYRKWPLFLVFYLVFAVLYFMIFYSWSDFSYRTIAETTVMTIAVTSFPILSYFHLRVVKIKLYRLLGIDLLFWWLGSTFFIYLLMLSYLRDMEWFGAIAFFFFYFLYFLFCVLTTFLVFRIKKSNARDKENHL